MVGAAVGVDSEGSDMMTRTWIRAGSLAALACMLGSGCATVATHYQIRSAYEQEARRNAQRGYGALCAVDGRMIDADDLQFWDMVRDNWPDYLKAVGLDFGTLLVAYIIYEKSRGHDTSEIQQIYVQPPAGGDDAGAEGGGGE